MQNNTRRQIQRDETRSLLLEQARAAFARQGYREASIDGIALQAGLTKGAVYHHFRNKQALFAACYEDQVRRMTEIISAVPMYADHPWQSAMNRCRAFLDFGRRAQGAAITLQEAISVLGWARWRALDQDYSMGIVQQSVDSLVAAGLLETANPELVADMIYNLLVGAAMAVSTSANPRETREQAMTTLAAMIRGLRPEPSAAASAAGPGSRD